jgi:hypothetical protein
MQADLLPFACCFPVTLRVLLDQNWSETAVAVAGHCSAISSAAARSQFHAVDNMQQHILMLLTALLSAVLCSAARMLRNVELACSVQVCTYHQLLLLMCLARARVLADLNCMALLCTLFEAGHLPEYCRLLLFVL